MADYTNSKHGIASIHPEDALESPYNRLEPLIGYDDLIGRHLFGIPLVSQWADPITKKMMVMTPELVKTIVDGAVQQAEVECKIDIFPVKHREKYPYDHNHYVNFGYMQTRSRPIHTVDKLSVTPSNGGDIYILPLEWLENAYYVRGQINIIPMTAAFIAGGTVPVSPAGTAYYLSFLGSRSWIPAFWQVEYTTGYPDGLIPRIVNELVGTIAAAEILSMMAVTFARNSSHSLSIDGLSQSVSTPGPQIFKVRMDELNEKRKRLVNQIRAIYGRKIFSSHV
jgi:hypothetical protein